MDRHAVVEALEAYALLLELAGENPFKVRAFTNGARALEGVAEPLDEAVASGSLKQVKGIGAGLFADITALVTTGKLQALEDLRASTPAGLLEMTEVPGLGPKKIKAIHEGLGIASVGELEYAIGENRLLDLSGFGEKTQAKIAASIALWKRSRGRRLLADALPAAEKLAAAYGPEATLVGGLRRRCETVDAIALVIATADAAAAEARLAGLPGVSRGDEGRLRLDGVLPIDARFVAPAEAVPAIFEATGSDAFLAAVKARGPLPAAPADEAAIFDALGLAFVPPELREDAAALDAKPVALVDEADLQGAFHVHTTYSDGAASVRDMVMAARRLGWRYVGISDHSEAAVYARGLTRERIAQQQAEIAALNAEFDDITVLSGIEADILADGSLDYDDETLAGFDFVIGSVHSRFGQDRDAMTARLTAALAHPRLTILGHMTGRLLLAREPYDFDLEAVLDAAAKHGKVIELNANPHRLDIDWRVVGRAVARGIPIAVNPDAHSPDGLADVRWGVAAARKGGLAAADVFNTQPVEAIVARLARN